MTDMTINQNAEPAKKTSFGKKLLKVLLIPYKIFEFIVFWGVLLYGGSKLVVKLYFDLILYLNGLK
jgi:hypothetical protein